MSVEIKNQGLGGATSSLLLLTYYLICRGRLPRRPASHKIKILYRSFSGRKCASTGHNICNFIICRRDVKDAVPYKCNLRPPTSELRHGRGDPSPTGELSDFRPSTSELRHGRGDPSPTIKCRLCAVGAGLPRPQRERAKHL